MRVVSGFGLWFCVVEQGLELGEQLGVATGRGRGRERVHRRAVVVAELSEPLPRRQRRLEHEGVGLAGDVRLGDRRPS